MHNLGFDAMRHMSATIDFRDKKIEKVKNYRQQMGVFHLAGSVLHCSFSFIISFTHVGQISFQNQPNAICTHVGSNVAGSWTDTTKHFNLVDEKSKLTPLTVKALVRKFT